MLTHFGNVTHIAEMGQGKVKKSKKVKSFTFAVGKGNTFVKAIIVI